MIARESCQTRVNNRCCCIAATSICGVVTTVVVNLNLYSRIERLNFQRLHFLFLCICDSVCVCVFVCVGGWVRVRVRAIICLPSGVCV